MPLEKGEKVVIRGEICGVVQYVGHVDSLNFPEIYVGLRLSQCSKYCYNFKSPNYGLFIIYVPLSF